MCRTTHSRSHSQQPRGDLLARNNNGNKVEFVPNAVLDAEDERESCTAQPKDENWSEVWANSIAPVRHSLAQLGSHLTLESDHIHYLYGYPGVAFVE